MDEPIAGSLHHVELWVPDLGRAVKEWGWLLGRLGYESFQDWPDGRSWRLGGTYLVVEQSPNLTGAEHDRLRPGLNHLAFHAGSRQRVDELAADGPAHGWTLLFSDRHPVRRRTRALRRLSGQHRQLRGRTRRHRALKRARGQACRRSLRCTGLPIRAA